jgi:MFS transporter, DHA1 family, solute carrier family 18 (vesicular amine transporter), member 1/2
MLSTRTHPLAVRMVVLVAIWLDALLYGLVVPFLPERALAQGASTFGVGALFATYALGVVIATYPVGVLTDRFGPRRTLLGGLIMLLVATLLFGFAEDISRNLPFIPPLWLLFAARGAQGMAAAATWTAGLAILARQSARASHAALFAQAGTAMGVGTLLGPPLGGILYSIGGFRTPFLFAAGLACLDGLGRLLVLPNNSTAVDGSAPTKPARSPALFRRRVFLLALLAIAAGDLILTALEPTLPPLFTYSFGLTPLIIGLLFGGLVAGYTVAQTLAASLASRVPRTLVLTAGLAVSAVALVGFANAVTLLDTIVALLALAFGTSFVLIAGLDLLTASGEEGFVPADVPYGAIYAAYNLFSALGGLAGPLAAASFTALLGLRYTFLLMGVPMLVLANLTVLGALISDRRR